MFGFPDWLLFTILVCVCFFFEKHRATKRVKPLYLLLFHYYVHGVPMDMVSLQLELCGTFVWYLMWMFHELKSPIIHFWVRFVVHFLVVDAMLLPCLRYKLEYIERERMRKEMLESKYERDSANRFWVHQFLGNPLLMESYRVEQNSNGQKVRISCRGKDSRNNNGQVVRRSCRGKDKSRSRSRHS